jgi:signal transduction histidine kinase
MFDSVRTRLTLWYAGVLALSLIAFAVLVYYAVKYTPAGGEITIAVAAQNGDAQIIVSDSGIGISAADQPRIFDRFYRVDKARSRALGGAGLGLSIARWIVESHGGSLSVERHRGGELVQG